MGPRNEDGGIEGMPLQLLITAIVAGLTLAAVLGWAMSVPTPSVIKTVSADPPIVYLGNVPEDEPAIGNLSIRVTAYDAKDATIPGIVVALSGVVGGTVVGADADDGVADGTVVLVDVSIALPPRVVIGELALTIQKAGYPAKSWTIPIVRGA